MRTRTADDTETASRATDAHRSSSLSPVWGPRVTPSRSRGRSSRLASPFSDDDALRRPRGRTRDARVDAQCVSSGRKQRSVVSVSPIVPSGSVFGDEFEHTSDCLDSFRGGLRGNPRARISPRGRRFRRGAEGLTEHRVSPDKRQVAQGHVFAGALHALGYFGIQLCLELSITEAKEDSRPYKPERQPVRQRAIGVEKIVGHLGLTFFAESIRDHAWPVVRRFDQTRDGRVAERVSHLLEHVAFRDEQHHARLVRRPEVFPATQRGVLGFGDEFVKDLEKLRQARVWIGQYAVPMVGHEAHGLERDAGALGGEYQAVLDAVFGEARRAQQELELRAAASGEVGPIEQIFLSRVTGMVGRCTALGLRIARNPSRARLTRDWNR